MHRVIQIIITVVIYTYVLSTQNYVNLYDTYPFGGTTPFHLHEKPKTERLRRSNSNSLPDEPLISEIDFSDDDDDDDDDDEDID